MNFCTQSGGAANADEIGGKALARFKHRRLLPLILDRIAKLEENVTNITAERDDLSAKLEAAELAYNILRTEYNNFRKNPGNTRPAKVPHCKSCKSCKRTEVAVGKVVFSCERMDGKQIFVGEGRTSPKWCPLRGIMALGEASAVAADAIKPATDAVRKFAREAAL